MNGYTSNTMYQSTNFSEPFLISCNQQPFSEKAHSDSSESDDDQMTEYAVFSIYFQVPLELDDMPLIL